MRLAASTVQSRQIFESTLPEELFELKNEETIKKSENLRDICTYSSPQCMTQSNLVRQFL
jgi:hypothetical protein